MDFQSKQARAVRHDMTDLLKDMKEMSGLLVKATARISELEMRVELLSEELKGKSKVVDLTRDEDKENEDVDVLGSPFCLDPRRSPMREAAIGMLWTARGPSEPPEEIDYVGVLREAFEMSGWGQEVVVGEKNPESPEGQ